MCFNYLLLVICNFLVISFVSPYVTTNFHCRHVDPWPVDYSDNQEASEKFQRWLYAWQHDCNRKQVIPRGIGEIGLGATMHYLLSDMLGALANNKIYQTYGDSIWAEKDPSKCSYNISGFDCFMLPLSPCNFESSLKTFDILVDKYKDIDITEAISNYSTTALNICDMGKLSRKSMQWVHGQLMNYLLRPRFDVKTEIDKRLSIVLQKSSSDPDNLPLVVIAVQVRAINPKTIDLNRQRISVDTYMKFIDLKVAELASRGVTVTTVYLCSHVPEENIKSSSYMQLTYPRPYRFVVIPHSSFGEGSGEVEYLIHDKQTTQKPPQFNIVTDYLADIAIMAKADVFIGTFSNLYPVVAGIRIANQFGIANNCTCYLDTRGTLDPQLKCEGNSDAHNIWKTYMGKFDYKDAGEGFSELYGTPF